MMHVYGSAGHLCNMHGFQWDLLVVRAWLRPSARAACYRGLTNEECVKAVWFQSHPLV